MNDIYEKIHSLAEKYSKNLRQKMDERVVEMKKDDNSHYLLYRVLGIATEEGRLIDEYQNMWGDFFTNMQDRSWKKLQFCALKKSFLKHRKKSVSQIS